MTSSLDSILSTAASGMRASQAGIAVLSDNIANAGVAGYTSKTQETSAFQVGGQSNGVRTGLVTRSVDAAVQGSLWSSASKVAALTVRSQVMSSIDATQGTPGDGTSLSDVVTALQSSFTALQAQPSGQTQQASVVAAAGTLATTINDTANAITHQRNAVQADIVTSVDQLNAAMDTVQSTTHDLIAAHAGNTDTSNLEDTRDAALQTLSGLLDLHYDKQSNGDITILGHNGFSIPLNSRFSTQSAVLSPQSAYAAGSTAVPPILLQSSNPSIPAVDVTSVLAGGRVGELVALRDTTLPSYTAKLDAFSAKVASAFSAQGLQLFTDGTAAGTVANTAGVSAQIQVNSLVVANPALIRDGTPTSLNTSNTASFTGLIDKIVTISFATSGSTTSLGYDAQGFVSQQATAASLAGSDLASASAYQTTIASRFSDGSGVNVDHEMGLMIQLQNSYAANARVVQTTQAMFTALLNATSPNG
jgi:flagellar hook-associated protein 1 FlgK